MTGRHRGARRTGATPDYQPRHQLPCPACEGTGRNVVNLECQRCHGNGQPDFRAIDANRAGAR